MEQLTSHANNPRLEHLLTQAVLRAGKLLYKNSPHVSGQPVDVVTKEDGSPVTRFDRESSDIILSQLRKLDPRGWLVSEEEIPTAGTRHGSSWYVDPLDGTKQFIKGENIFAVFVGRRQEDRFTFGLMYYPALGILVRSGIGLESTVCSLKGYFDPVKAAKAEGQFIAARKQDFDGPGRINFEFPTRNLPMVAVFAGVADAGVAQFPNGVSLWDISATLAIADTMGFSVSDLQGQPVKVNDMRMTSTGLLICKPNVKQRTLSILNKRG